MHKPQDSTGEARADAPRATHSKADDSGLSGRPAPRGPRSPLCA
eukprot:CAMPEP_0170594876 /NCGR_PEP_ID=MMETSP0224-20130122/14240_1 /TAXON_ID=285029 /ORGANISM="Togula jolla, Strain CCCM 725" /LENGTH=43 /DNA_ID= /DNA_START= /DNA_END= /DNA_ORIENTATION=